MELKIKSLDLCIETGKIIGIYDDKFFIDTINKPVKHNIYIDDNCYSKYDVSKIAIIDEEKPFYTSKVLDEILFNAKIRNYKTKNIQQEIDELLKRLNMDNKILNRITNSLSMTEKYFIKVISNLIYKPQVVIFKNVTSELDRNNSKLISSLINYLKEKGILVIITSMDSNVLYNLSDDIIIFKNDKVILKGSTNEIYTDVEMLIEKEVDIPCFSMLTYKANKEYDAHLFYRKDVRDVIKDVYKSVS